MGSLAATSWETQADKCRKILRDSFNPAWLLSPKDLPTANQLNVSTFIETCNLLTPRELEITAASATVLVQQMASGSLTAVETVTAFLKRAHVAHQLTNFATEFMVDEALAAAAELDCYYKETGKLKGPLHGLPISTKEHIGHKGRIAHSAYVAWVDNVAEDDALMVKLCKNAGAVFHVRTNEPQSVMHIDCSNPIYGTTVNPHNRALTCGGSSGGEGSSLGLRCAALGIGTDIGGSVRVPAAFCGSYSLRTTALRNPYKGVCLPGGGQESVRCVISPLANSVGDLNLFQSAVLDQEPWEIETPLVPLPWRRLAPLQPGQVTIGVIWDDGLVHPHPPVLRALTHAVAKLKAASVRVIDFEPYDHMEGFDIISALYFPDAARTQKDILEKSGEPIAALTEWAFGLARPEPLSIPENWELNMRRDAYREAYHRIMKERGVDFILCPAYVGAAATLGGGQYFLYTAIWNILDQPCTTFPTGLKVDPTIDVVDKDYEPRSEDDQREYKKSSIRHLCVTEAAMTKARLRAKTGCFTCERRKVKCGEERPSCRNCAVFGRECVWPTSLDMSDRRNRSPISPSLSADESSPFSSSSSTPSEDPQSLAPGATCNAMVSYRSTSPRPGRPLFQSDIEMDLIYHFCNYYYSNILLPTRTDAHFMESQSELIDMMLQCKSVKHAVLACCASNKHVLLNESRYQNIALQYYSKAVHELNQTLVKFQPGSDGPHHSLLTTVIFLYVHDLWGADSEADPRKHVAGAIKLLDLLCQNSSSSVSMTRGFDRVIAESVLYQAFLLSIRRPFAPDFHIEPQFVARAERLLAPGDITDPSYAASSPVLGVPTSLYRLILDMINFQNSPTLQNSEGLTELRSEMDHWEALVVPRDPPRLTPISVAYTFDLVILAASLLLDLITESSTYQLPIDLVSLSNSSQPTRWQVDLCLEILRQPQQVEKWTRCFLGAWPMLILGYAVRSDEDMKLIQQVLEQMRQRIGYGEVHRIQDELDKVWKARGRGIVLRVSDLDDK
ncbi:amidase signature domain-containing protein [Dactylonectria macrodidyma]|uniref:amidase n=1 Tax=Dactylonectria macrodidyma TaxID=307937 RepID=A0A9P9IKW7_9HYPO|nr:amidase signature domain-containing protein [Dactylonectria macrodidyma]